MDIVLRQTDYDEATAKAKLEEHGGSFEKVIREYITGSSEKKTSQVKLTTNQQVYHEIRNFMDNASVKHLSDTNGINKMNDETEENED